MFVCEQQQIILPHLCFITVLVAQQKCTKALRVGSTEELALPLALTPTKDDSTKPCKENRHPKSFYFNVKIYAHSAQNKHNILVKTYDAKTESFLFPFVLTVTLSRGRLQKEH